MNILLTGGTGYIGSHIAVVLAEAGHDVILYDNFCNSQPEVLQQLKLITGKEIALVRGDVRDTALLISTLKAYHVDAVFHCAGLKAVGESVVKPIHYYANNVQGTISLLEAMQKVYGSQRVKNLIFSSSATVYGDPIYLPIDEEHPLRATNPYGRTKIHIEEMLVDVVRVDSSWNIACLRYFNPVGAHESGLIGEAPNGVPNNLVPYMLQVAIGKFPQLNIFGNDYSTTDGTGVRDYIHVMDLAEGHLAALNYLCVQHTGLCIFNLGTGRGYSVLDIVNAFEASINQRIPYKIMPRRIGDPPTCYANVDKSASHLIWQAKRTMKDILESAWRWQSRHVTFKVEEI